MKANTIIIKKQILTNDINAHLEKYKNMLDNNVHIVIDGKEYRMIALNWELLYGSCAGTISTYGVEIEIKEIKEVAKMEKKNELEEFKEFCESQQICGNCKYFDNTDTEMDSCFNEWLKDNNKLMSSYQNKVKRTRSFSDTELANYTLGLVCEAGEVGDIIKKHVYHDHTLDKDKVIDELGDVMWYLNNICNVLDIKIEDVANRNIEKLLKRYPSGFSSDDSINRVESRN